MLTSTELLLKYNHSYLGNGSEETLRDPFSGDMLSYAKLPV